MDVTWLRTVFKVGPNAQGPSDTAPSESSATVPSDELAESRASIRATTKWLVAAAGAVGAITVAGLQLTKLPPSIIGRTMGLIGFGLAIVGVGLVIVQAADVLVVGYTHIGELAELRTDAITAQEGGKPRRRPLAGITFSDFIRDTETELPVLSRGEASDISDLYKQLDDCYTALRNLRDEASVTVDDNRYTKRDVPFLIEKVRALELAARQLITFSNQRAAEASFKRLKGRVALGGALLAVGAALFALASTLGRPVAVLAPTAVVIYPAHNTTAFGKYCAATSLHGVAIGGDWAAPVVSVNRFPPNCPSVQLTITRDIGIVVPVVNAAQSGIP